MGKKSGMKWTKKATGMKMVFSFENEKSAQKAYRFMNESLKEDDDVRGTVFLVLRGNKVIIKADATEAKHFFGDFLYEPEYETITDEETGVKRIVTKEARFKI